VLHGGAPTSETCTKQTWVKITPGPSHHLGCDTTMAKKKKLFAGVGAKCTVLTKFVRPKLAGFADDHRTTCILKEMRTIRVNKKDQECFVFEENGVDYHAVKRYFKVIEEGDASGFNSLEEEAAQRRAKEAADAFKEPKVKWRKSKAKHILYELLMDGTIPLGKARGAGVDVHGVSPNDCRLCCIE
jgi:hypothetical protein